MDPLSLLLRVALSLGCVLGLIWLLARGGRRRTGGRVAAAGRFAVVGRQSLGRHAGVAVVRVGDRALVLGVTEQSVQLLAETDLASVVGEQEAAEHRTAVELPLVDGLPVAEPDLVLVGPGEGVPAARSPLDGSALSPQTWSRALEALRERTTRG